MAFTVMHPGRGRADQVRRGIVRIGVFGMARFHFADLAEVHIAEAATILIDRERPSIAIRALAEGEAGYRVGAEESGPVRTVWLAGALKAIGLAPRTAAGLVPCRIVEDRLELVLTPANGVATSSSKNARQTRARP